MNVPMWYTRNTSLSELGLSTAADVNKILKERKQNCLPVFLTTVMCSYLQFLHPQLLLLTEAWASQGSLAPRRESSGSCLLMTPGSCSHHQTPPAGHHLGGKAEHRSTGKPDGDELQSPPLRQGQSSHSQPREVFAPKIKKNKHGRVTPPLPIRRSSGN